MKKQYNTGMEMLEVGYDNISDHLGWLSRIVISLTTKDTDAVASVVYNKDLPKNVWGVFFGPTRSIALNLEQHFFCALDEIQNANSMHTSIRVLILHDLLDSIAHEAWHAKVSLEKEDWSASLDEPGAKDHGRYLSWQVAELFDVNMKSFGLVLDSLIHGLYKNLREDVQEAGCKEWKKIQYHMLNNDLNYYNPNSDVEIRSIREVFQAQCQPEVPWLDVSNSLFTSFSEAKVYSTVEQNIPETKISAIPEDSNIQNTIFEPTPEPTPEPVKPVEVIPVEAAPVQAVQPVQATPTVMSYNPLDDLACTMEDPFAEDYDAYDALPLQEPAHMMPVEPMSVKPALRSMDVQQSQSTMENVLRRIFYHVYTKCNPDGAGNFNNVNAVLDPINISDIKGHEMFDTQDTIDINGAFSPRAKIGGFVKGLPTKESSIPRYTFYLNIGGNTVKHVFMAQNPSKIKDGALTAWAQKAANGWRRMSLFTDNGILMYLESEPQQPLGQEKLVNWEKK